MAQYWSGAKGDDCAADTVYPGRMNQWATQTCATTDSMIWSKIVPVFYSGTSFTYLNNLFVNPNAEDPSTYMWSTNGNTNAKRVSGGAHDGGWYWSMQTMSSGKDAKLQQEQLEDGTGSTRYTVGASLKCFASGGSCGVSIKLIVTASNGTWKSATDNLTVSNDGKWHTYSYDPAALGVVPSTVTVKILSKAKIGIDTTSLTAPFGGA